MPTNTYIDQYDHISISLNNRVDNIDNIDNIDIIDGTSYCLFNFNSRIIRYFMKKNIY
jgi:hypothetical protein